MLVFDHLAVAAETLASGVDWLETRLGVRMAGGGQHPLMATHNRLIGLGDLYLEVIAIDPDAPAPPHPRWFDLDRFADPPRLTNWIARCDDLDAAFAAAPPGMGVPLALARGDFRWRMAVPPSGILPFDGAFPALIQWQGRAHPAPLLPDVGLRLDRLEIAHPEAATLTRALAGLMHDPRIAITSGPLTLRATITTPHGPRVLE